MADGLGWNQGAADVKRKGKLSIRIVGPKKGLCESERKSGVFGYWNDITVGEFMRNACVELGVSPTYSSCNRITNLEFNLKRRMSDGKKNKNESEKGIEVVKSKKNENHNENNHLHLYLVKNLNSDTCNYHQSLEKAGMLDLDVVELRHVTGIDSADSTDSTARKSLR